MKVGQHNSADGTSTNVALSNQGMPTKPEDVSKNDQQAFIARFKQLDTDKSGVLEQDEYDKAAVSDFKSFNEARQLVTKDNYLTQSDFVVARAQYQHAKHGGTTTPAAPSKQPDMATQAGKTPQPKLQSKPLSGALADQPEALRQWDNMIAAASRASGVPAQILTGQVWAESRGRMHTNTQNPDGKTRDLGVMQIGQGRWLSDVVPRLSSADRAAITAETGLKPEALQMSNPLHNLIGGAFHVRNWKDGNYGQPATNWGGALNGYVNGNINQPRPIGPSDYSNLVRGYAAMINDRVQLQGFDYQYHKLFG